MRQKAEYRSAIRSRKLIRQAFVDLMQEKEIDRISIQDIVNRADVNRGTFYAHYAGTYAVLEQIENEIISTLLELLDEFQHSKIIENPLPFLTKVADFLEQDLEFYRSLIRAKGAITFLNKLKALFIDKIVSDEKTLSRIKNKDQFFIYVNFFTSGMVGLYQDWFNHKLNNSLNDLTQALNQIIKNGFQPFLSGVKR
jgi:AcrR family transcriptional regulator